jgi:glycolate oxidase
MQKDVFALKQELTAILGEKNCLFSLEDRWTYSFDASKEHFLPDAVVFPACTEHVCAVMRYAYANRIPVAPRGAGSGLTGGAIPVKGGIVMVLERLNRILELDTENMCAVVEPGVITAQLQEAAAKAGLFYPPDPASRNFSTIGGNIAENAGGMRAAKYGVTKQYVLGLEVVLPDGALVTLGSKCIKDVVGYSMTELFVGSEGTFGVITKALVRLVNLPETVKTLSVGFGSMRQAGLVVPMLLKSGAIPCALEFMDATCLKALRETDGIDWLQEPFHEAAQAMLLIELDGSVEAVEREAAVVREICEQSGMLSFLSARDASERDKLWQARRAIHGTLMGLCPKWMEEDISVPPASIPMMLDTLQVLAARENLRILCFGHFADGNIHLNVSEADSPLSLARADFVKKEIFLETVKLGGRIAAEHGIGFLKKEYLGLNLNDATLHLALRIKKMLDPEGILNPGKVFPREIWDGAYRATEERRKP